MKQFVTAFVFLALCVPVLAADITGVWRLDALREDRSGTLTVLMTFKQTAGKLTGTCKIEDTGEIMSASGEINGNEVTWECRNERGEAHTSQLKGTLDSSGSTMAGTWVAEISGTFTARKQ
jgi:hypothetical protein